MWDCAGRGGGTITGVLTLWLAEHPRTPEVLREVLADLATTTRADLLDALAANPNISVADLVALTGHADQIPFQAVWRMLNRPDITATDAIELLRTVPHSADLHVDALAFIPDPEHHLSQYVTTWGKVTSDWQCVWRYLITDLAAPLEHRKVAAERVALYWPTTPVHRDLLLDHANQILTGAPTPADHAAAADHIRDLASSSPPPLRTELLGTIDTHPYPPGTRAGDELQWCIAPTTTTPQALAWLAGQDGPVWARVLSKRPDPTGELAHAALAAHPHDLHVLEQLMNYRHPTLVRQRARDTVRQLGHPVTGDVDVDLLTGGDVDLAHAEAAPSPWDMELFLGHPHVRTEHLDQALDAAAAAWAQGRPAAVGGIGVAVALSEVSTPIQRLRGADLVAIHAEHTSEGVADRQVLDAFTAAIRTHPDRSPAALIVGLPLPATTVLHRYNTTIGRLVAAATIDAATGMGEQELRILLSLADDFPGTVTDLVHTVTTITLDH